MNDGPRTLFIHEKLKQLTISNIELRDALNLLARHLPFLEEHRQIGAAERNTIIAAMKGAVGGAPELPEIVSRSREMH